MATSTRTLKDQAFERGICITCNPLFRGERGKMCLDKMAEQWNATYSISEDGRYAKFQKVIIEQ